MTDEEAKKSTADQLVDRMVQIDLDRLDWLREKFGYVLMAPEVDGYTDVPREYIEDALRERALNPPEVVR